MSRLLLRSGFRGWLRHPGQALLSVLGVALGVALVTGMDLALESSREAFRLSAETVAGRATHQVVAEPGSVPDSVFRVVRMEAGVGASAPVVEGHVASPALPGRSLRVLGVDPFSEEPFRPYLAGAAADERGGGADGPGFAGLLAETGGLLLSRETASEAGVEPGDTLPLAGPTGQRSGTVLGVLEPEDDLSRQGLRDLLVMDVSEAQTLLGRRGELDRVDLILPEGAEGARQARAVEVLLPSSLRLEPRGARADAMADMARAFDLNLTALSLLGVVFGIFLIYNTVTFSVVRRREAFGVMRALGVTPGQLRRAILGEAAAVGVLGSAVGLLLGVALGEGLVGLVARTLDDLYFAVSVTGVGLEPASLAKGAALGVGGTLLAAWPPASEASRVVPRAALARSELEEATSRRGARGARIGLGLLALGGAVIAYPTTDVLPGFVGLFAAVTGFALLTPGVAAVLVRGVLPALRKTGGAVGAMAGRGVLAAQSRTGPALAALVIAVSVTVGLGIMIQSFRGSVESWLGTTLQADLHVASPGTGGAGGPSGALPEALVAGVADVEGVDAVSTSRRTDLGPEYGMAHLVAAELDPRDEGAYELLQGQREEAFAAFRDEEGAFLSEPLAYRRGKAPGDSILLPTTEGERAFPVAAVYRDYGSERGTALLSRSTYDRHWDDPAVTSLRIHLAEGADPEAVADALRARAPVGAPVEVRFTEELREASLEIFDRTFHVTVALRALAFGVAFVGILSALMALQLERTRELGILRAGGMTPAQLWRMVMTQTGLMGAVSGVLAVPVGLALAAVMVFVVNRRSFGWTLDLEVGGTVPLQAVALAVGGALLAGLYPAWRMARTSPAEALRGE